MFCHNRKDLKTEGSSKTWKMKSGKWCGVEKMKTGSMVKCSTLKEAELIPDSAVPYTLPESRCNSSNHQTSKFESGRDLTHLTTCVRQRTLKKRPKTSRSIREVEPQLVSQREELAAYIFVCVCSQCCRFRLRRGKNSARISECSEHSQQIVCWTEQSRSEVTGTLRHGMPLEKSVEHSACLMFECVYLCEHTSWTVLVIFSCKQSNIWGC